MAEDPRYRTKVWLEKYLTPANLTMDDGSTKAYFLVSYANPDYPLSKVFREMGVDVTFSLGGPNSTSDMDPLTEAPYGYEEHVLITINCVDKVGITGEKLFWKAEAELRSVAESYPTGSLRALSSRRPTSEDLGGMVVYGGEYILTYRRDTS